MIRLLTASALAALSCTAAHAELRDVSLLQSEGRTQLWLAFDSQPQSVEIQPGSGLVLHVDGVSLDRSRHIEPAVRGPVSALALSRAPNGVSISMSGAFAGGEAEVREGGVLVTLSGVTGQSAPIRRSPPRAPVSEQGAMSGPTASPASEPAASSSSSTPSSASEPSEQHSAGGADAASSEPQDLAPAPSPAPAPASAGSAAGTQAQMRELGGDLVIDESVCPDSAARLADAPWDLNLLSTHADCLVSVGDSESAVSLYQRVLAFDPRHFQAALGLARILSDQGDHQAAAELFETAASAARTDGQAVQARMAARRARELAGSGGERIGPRD